MVEFEVDMEYCKDELDCVILHDENGEMEDIKFVPESKDFLKEVYDWAYFNMECCDEPEWSLFTGIVGVISKYRIETRL